MNLPGYEEAISLGYYLNYYAGGGNSATYTKEGIQLTIKYKGDSLEACLEYIWKLLVIKAPSFSFPNKNFKEFESQMLLVKIRLEVG